MVLVTDVSAEEDNVFDWERSVETDVVPVSVTLPERLSERLVDCV